MSATPQKVNFDSEKYAAVYDWQQSTGHSVWLIDYATLNSDECVAVPRHRIGDCTYTGYYVKYCIPVLDPRHRLKTYWKLAVMSRGLRAKPLPHRVYPLNIATDVVGWGDAVLLVRMSEP